VWYYSFEPGDVENYCVVKGHICEFNGNANNCALEVSENRFVYAHNKEKTQAVPPCV
jgi:hypothetical protein